MTNMTKRAASVIAAIAVGSAGSLLLFRSEVCNLFQSPPILSGYVSAAEAKASSDKAGTMRRSGAKAEQLKVVENESQSTGALHRKVRMLEQGRDYLRSVPNYTAVLKKQEVVGSQLLDEQTIFMKCRHQPFSVYLKWQTGDAGREVLYVNGSNNGKMIAHDGGWKARIPAFSLSPDCALAMADSRYPVTEAGLLGLLELMLDVHLKDLAESRIVSCELEEDHEFDGRPCLQFITKYKPGTSTEYRKSITLVDKEWNIPVDSRHYDWPKRESANSEHELDRATLIESYSFVQVKLGDELTDHDFDRANPEYRFR